MTPKQAAANLREWAAAYLDPEPLAMDNFYKSCANAGSGCALQQIFLFLTGFPGKASDYGVNQLTDYRWPDLCSKEKDPDHHALFLCFLADVIETDGTDWIQNV